MIRIKSGTFGFHNGKFVELKTSKSDPFEIDPKREAELVEMGVAEYVGAQDPADAEDDDDAEFSQDDYQDEDDAPAVKIVDDVEITVEILEGMKLDVLRAFAEPYGVKYEVGMKKADFAQAVFDAIEEQGDEGQDEGESGEQPPGFDPAGAIV